MKNDVGVSVDKCKKTGCTGHLVIQEYISRASILGDSRQSVTTEVMEFKCDSCGLKHSFESQNASGF